MHWVASFCVWETVHTELLAQRLADSRCSAKGTINIPLLHAQLISMGKTGPRALSFSHGYPEHQDGEPGPEAGSDAAKPASY